MNKITLILVLSMVSVGSMHAMQWGASSPEEVAEGLALEQAIVRDTMRVAPGNKDKTDEQLNAEIDAGLAPELRQQLVEFRKLNAENQRRLQDAAKKNGLQN